MPDDKNSQREAIAKQRRQQKIRREAERLIKRAAKMGMVLTIEQKPLKPLAMGYYKTISSVRPQRVLAKPPKKYG